MTDLQLTDEQRAEVTHLNAQLEILDKAQHSTRCRRNAILGRPAPPTVAAMAEKFEELLRDQNDCAQYLEPDTRKVSRCIYNDSGLALAAFSKDYTHQHWEGDGENEDDDEDDED